MSSDVKRLQKPAVRKIATARWQYAMNLAQSLHDDMHTWWADAEPKTDWVVSDDRLSVEFVVDVPMPPVELWQMRANDVVQNLRDSLTALSVHAAREFAAPGTKIDITFPASMTEEGWDHWKGHKYLPTEVANRFRAIQPFQTRRLDLHGLREVSNLEKHEFIVAASCQPSEIRLEHAITVEGEWTDADEAATKFELLDATIHGGRQSVLRIAFPRPITRFSAEPGEYSLAVWLTVPRFVPPAGWESVAAADPTDPSSETTEIKLLEVLDHWRHEVAWVIAYITGQYNSATIPPTGGLNLHS